MGCCLLQQAPSIPSWLNELRKHLRTIEHGLETLMSIKPVSYHRNKNDKGDKNI